MTKIREYNTATGHVETIAEVPDDQVQSTMNRLADGSTDHVLYAEIPMGGVEVTFSDGYAMESVRRYDMDLGTYVWDHRTLGNDPVSREYEKMSTGDEAHPCPRCGAGTSVAHAGAPGIGYIVYCRRGHTVEDTIRELEPWEVI